MNVGNVMNVNECECDECGGMNVGNVMNVGECGGMVPLICFSH
jgi:hypothetical protein